MRTLPLILLAVVLMGSPCMPVVPEDGVPDAAKSASTNPEPLEPWNMQIRFESLLTGAYSYTGIWTLRIYRGSDNTGEMVRQGMFSGGSDITFDWLGVDQDDYYAEMSYDDQGFGLDPVEPFGLLLSVEGREYLHLQLKEAPFRLEESE